MGVLIASRARVPALTALAAVVALSGCGPSKAPAPPCPPVYILSDVARVTKYRPGAGRDLTDVMAEAEIVGFKGECGFSAKGTTVDLQLSFDVRRGPAAEGRETELRYFVAIPKFYPAPEAKAEFSFPVVFPNGLDQVRVSDESVALRIPVKGGEVIDQYEIYLGFQATPEELEMNRRMKR